MAYRLSCDNESCGKEIESGEGQPGISVKSRIYCSECAGYVRQVEEALKVEMIQFAHEGVERLNARRQELMKQMLPSSRGGGEGHDNGWLKVG